jgi:hypothetical protein
VLWGRATASSSRLESRTDGTRRRDVAVVEPLVRLATGGRTDVVMVSTPGIEAGRSCRSELLMALDTAPRMRCASASVHRSSTDKSEAREAESLSVIVELAQQQRQAGGLGP